MLPNEAERRIHQRILVVDDEPLIRKLLATRLRWCGYDVNLATHGEDALESFQREPADLVVLDLMLPRINGLEVLRAIRVSSDVPVLMLTACDRIADRILGLELGADDYVIKPFSMSELEARIRALLRRATRYRPSQRLLAASHTPKQTVISGLTIHHGIRQVFRGLTQIKLTPMQFRLLEFLVSKEGQPVSRRVIMEEVWGVTPQRHGDTRVIDAHIARLRLKLELDPKNPELIITTRSLGYQLQRLEESAN